MNKMVIFGGGCYGTALANCFSRSGQQIYVVEQNPLIIQSVNEKHENSISLPGIKLSDNITFVDSFAQLSNIEAVIVAVPAKHVSSVGEFLKQSNLSKNTPVILCSKGFDLDGRRPLFYVLEEMLDSPISVLSGPSFAAEIASGKFAIVNLASKNTQLAENLANQLTSLNFKVESLDDPIGLSVAGAMKNVLAICCGILSAKNFGNSGIASVIARGIQEIQMIIQFFGGNPSSVNSIGAIGDIFLTCNSLQSRNMSFGRCLAQNETWQGGTVEGLDAAQLIDFLSEKISIPLFQSVYKTINKQISVDELIYFV